MITITSRLVVGLVLSAVIPGCDPTARAATDRRAQRVVQTLGAEPAYRPSVYDLSSFAFFATSGTFRVYKLGELIEEQPTTDLGDGSLKFFILSPQKAMMLGNQGTTEVRVYRPGNGLSFIEDTPMGKHIFTVYDEWISHRRGFRATYNRTVKFAGETLRTTYSGYARAAR